MRPFIVDLSELLRNSNKVYLAPIGQNPSIDWLSITFSNDGRLTYVVTLDGAAADIHAPIWGAADIIAYDSCAAYDCLEARLPYD